MATADSVKAKIQAWIDLFNKKSGRNDTTFTDALVWYLFSIEPKLQTLTITENGTYTPPNGVTGYNKVEVSVDTQSFYDDGYNTGYSEGYEAGRNSVETA